MIKQDMMREELHKVMIRGVDHDVYVKLSSGPMTTIRFIYNKTNIERQVYLPDGIDDINMNRILTASVKEGIKIYNRKMKLKKEIM